MPADANNAHCVQAMLEEAGITTMLNPLSSTVVFERPQDPTFIRKWQLACEGPIAHVVVMPNITIDKLETFVAALIESRAQCATAATQRIAQDARLHADDPNDYGMLPQHVKGQLAQ